MNKAYLAGLVLVVVSLSAEAALIRWPLDFYAGYSRWYDNNPSAGAVRRYDGNTQLSPPPYYIAYDGHVGTDIKGGGIDPAYIRAGASGVVYQKVNTCADTPVPGCGSGFGNHVRIEHPDGMVTIYAHMLQASIRPEGSVICGNLVGLIGNSGSSDGRHLHLEFRRDRYLPPRTFDPFNGAGNIGVSYWTNQNGNTAPVNPSMTCS
ncbi:MAG: M23 family metallopeptidase [bacterium]|nr:M23 family metallopeptidase [bacterium]